MPNPESHEGAPEVAEQLDELKQQYEAVASRIIGEVSARFTTMEGYEDAAEEAYTEVYLKLQRYVERHGLPDNLPGFIATTVRNYFLDRIKKSRTGVEGHLQRVQPAADESEGDARSLEDTVAGADDVSEAVSETAAAEGFMAQLTPVQQEIVSLRLEGVPDRAIRTQLELTADQFQSELQSIQESYLSQAA